MPKTFVCVSTKDGLVGVPVYDIERVEPIPEGGCRVVMQPEILRTARKVVRKAPRVIVSTDPSDVVLRRVNEASDPASPAGVHGYAPRSAAPAGEDGPSLPAPLLVLLGMGLMASVLRSVSKATPTTAD